MLVQSWYFAYKGWMHLQHTRKAVTFRCKNLRPHPHVSGYFKPSTQVPRKRSPEWTFENANFSFTRVPTKRKFSKTMMFYTMMWMLHALWLVVAHDLLEYRYMDDVRGNLFSLFCSTWRAVLKMFVRLFRIKASESLEKKNLARSIYKEENGIKEKKKSSLQLNQRHTRLRLVCHFFVFTTYWRHLWSIIEKTHSNMESIC